MRLNSLMLFSVMVVATGCDDPPKLVETFCREDAECESGSVCDAYECVAIADRACSVVTDGNPIIQPAPHVVDFGEVDTLAPLLQTITIHNIGSCVLTIFNAELKSSGDPGFSCDFCDTHFNGGNGSPVEIFPGRGVDVVVGYAPTAPQRAVTELVIDTDDAEYPKLRVPVKAQYNGTPSLQASPSSIDFGFRANGANGAPRVLTITNQGTGESPITITNISMSPSSSTAFFLQDIPDLPAELQPIRINRGAFIEVNVQYLTSVSEEHAGEIIIESNLGNLAVPVTGNSLGPPVAAASPTMINYGNIVLGRTDVRTITISNTGSSPLQVVPQWGGVCDVNAPADTINTDFAFLPSTVPPIPPNGYTELHVQATATAAPTMANPSGTVQAILALATNDPSNPCIPVTLQFNGQLSVGGEVIKLDMTFDNGSDGVFDNDVRNVDMTLENPYGFICNKENASPTNWGNFGNASWMAFAPKEEPERIILADSLQDGTYRVQVAYMESCSSIPSGIAAAILGISVEALIAYLTGGFTIPGQSVGDLIQQICLNRKGTSGNVRIYVNGQLRKTTSFSLGSKGQTAYIQDIVRITDGTGSHFEVP